MRLIPKNWDSFQHYKDRRPPWIKLHRGLLDDRAFQRLPDASMALAPCLWLIASEAEDGSFDGSAEELAFRLRRDVKWVEDALKPLIDNEFFIEAKPVASKKKATRKQPATPEESRGEKETEKKPSSGGLERPESVSEKVWEDFLKLRKDKRAPLTQTALDGISREAEKAGITLADALAKCCQRGWQGFDAEWVAKAQPKRDIFAGAI